MPIKECRIKKGMTQIELAEKSGVHRTCIARYEKGKLKPSVVSLQRIAAALECSVDDLLKPIERR